LGEAAVQVAKFAVVKTRIKAVPKLREFWDSFLNATFAQVFVTETGGNTSEDQKAWEMQRLSDNRPGYQTASSTAKIPE
jgi:hypothetical protein